MAVSEVPLHAPVPSAARAAVGQVVWLLRRARLSIRRLCRLPSEAQMLAYTRASVELAVQRQLIYASTLVLSIAYYDTLFGAAFYLLNFLCDVLELRWSRRIQAQGRIPSERLRREFRVLLGFTVASSFAIALFVIGAARFEGIGGHFTPLFFLLAAAIFATMNNNEILLALMVRLVLYGVTFLYIPGADLIESGAPLGSIPWLHFFTAAFVLFFILDCARVFLSLSREKSRQLDALRLAEARAVRALALQTQFISVVSHELRTPLTSINGAIALAQSGRLGAAPPQVANLLTVAARNGKRLASLVNDILDVQKLSVGEMRFSLEPMTLDEVITECMEVNACLSTAVRIVRVAGGPRGGPVLVDRHRLQQVMSNVVSNAVKFSPPGGTVEIGTARVDGRLSIWVRDRGRGIPPDSEEMVFGQFTQVDASDQREKQGSGLGMHIARRIMASLGGAIRYESEAGRGTTFFIEVPEAG